MAFRWRADDGPILVVFGSTHYLKKKMAPLWKNFLDPHMQQKGTPACAYVRFAQCLCYSLSVIKWSDFHADIRMLNRILMLVNFGQGSRHWYHLFIFTLHRYCANTILSKRFGFNFLEVKKKSYLPSSWKHSIKICSQSVPLICFNTLNMLNVCFWSWNTLSKSLMGDHLVLTFRTE